MHRLDNNPSPVSLLEELSEDLDGNKLHVQKAAVFTCTSQILGIAAVVIMHTHLSCLDTVYL